MRASVLKDPVLLKRAGQFAWLSIDSDKPSNAAFVAKFPSEGVPIFLVINPETEKVALSWYGTASAPQLSGLMDDGLRTISGGGSGPEAILSQADAANAAKDRAKAAELYQKALEAGGKEWPKRARTVESLVMALYFAPNRRADCVQTALREAPSMKRDRSFVNTVYFALECAKPGSPEIAEARKLAEEGVKIPGVLSDDTSQLYMTLANSYRQEKDDAAATRTAENWAGYLRGQLDKAGSPDARMALDLQLVSAANFLKKPELAVAELERAERELPDDYNPPRLLTSVLANMGRLDDASRACARTIEKAYGAPKLRAYMTCGGILERKGDKPAAKKMYEDGIAFGSTLPEKTAKPTVDALHRAITKLEN